MRTINKTRYAILGMLLDGPCSGYEIKAFMARSTAYFWRESDSTIYPMLKILAKEKKVVSETAYVGKKRKEIFSISKTGRKEFQEWLASPTADETPRDEFMLKLFFITDEKEMKRLFEERLEKARATLEAFKTIEKRLEEHAGHPRQAIRLKLLQHGMALLKLEIKWLKEETC